ncbi:hypothetical protein RRG08_060547 [Elysia crispata]|uniref:Peroxidase n=1 Tax=Elysia crispata TaxID=231223 RepID=A0AAE1APM3_9GAST|nr:hypothetical protein RRG08_060547 [Elysia crispata]
MNNGKNTEEKIFGPSGPFSKVFPHLSNFFRELLQSPGRVKFQTQSASCQFPSPTCDRSSRFRSVDGYCNNLGNPAWGTPGWPFKRILPSLYDDGSNAPRTLSVTGARLPSARTVSRLLHTRDSDDTESKELTSMFTQFGQFLDHDIDLTPKTRDDSQLDCCDESIQFPVRGFYINPLISSKATLVKSRPLPGTCFTIVIPPPDATFNKTCMNFVRSRVFSPSFKCYSSTREQGNAVTSFIDGSQIYGSSLQQQESLREFRGGRLVGETSDMLPANSSTTCKSDKLEGKYCFGAGDVRVNEHPMLSALHLIFHRYHNHIADLLSAYNIIWNDERVFQETRKIMGAILQHIVYSEYLPPLLGPIIMGSHGLRESFFYRYKPEADPRIINSFATAAFRFGHSMVPGHLLFGDKRKPLESLFFSPHNIQHTTNSVLAGLIHGTITSPSQKSDRFFSTAVSHKLFHDETTGRSLDLVSLNVQRGRDHGLPSYTAFRKACRLPALTGTEPEMKEFLKVYSDINDIDLFSGGLSEPHVYGGAVGPTFACIVAQQFRDLKYGDRFWFETKDLRTGFTTDQLKSIKKVSLASVLCAVSGIKSTSWYVFKKASFMNPEVACSEIPQLDLSHWINIGA